MKIPRKKHGECMPEIKTFLRKDDKTYGTRLTSIFNGFRVKMLPKNQLKMLQKTSQRRSNQKPTPPKRTKTLLPMLRRTRTLKKLNQKTPITPERTTISAKTCKESNKEMMSVNIINGD